MRKALLLTMVLSLMTAAASGDIIVNNGDFSQGVSVWDAMGNQYEVRDTPTFGGPQPPSGGNFGYGAGHAIGQSLGVTVQEGEYTVSMYVAMIDAPPTAKLTLGFLNTSYDTWFSYSGFTEADMTPNGWVVLSHTWTVEAGDANIGQPLAILAYNWWGTSSQAWDDVAVTFTPVPEPATMGLLTVGGLVGLLRRRR